MKRIIGALAGVLLALTATGCSSHHDDPAPLTKPVAATLPACSATWTLAAKITQDAAVAQCESDGKPYMPLVKFCDLTTHEDVLVELVVGPSDRYAVFVEDAPTSEVDDGTGTGDYRDTETAAAQLAAC